MTVDVQTHRIGPFTAAGVIDGHDGASVETGKLDAYLELTVDPLDLDPSVSITISLDLGILGQGISVILPARAIADFARLLDAHAIHPGYRMINLNGGDIVTIRETNGYNAAIAATRDGLIRVSPARLIRPRAHG